MNPSKISIDIRAASHNPTILNPDFLKFNDVVDRHWVLAGDPICTPPFAMVRYVQGVRIFAQSENIIFTQLLDEVNQDIGIVIPGIASRYIKKLPFVDYNEVNTTFGASLRMGEKEAKAFVLERFFKDGAWNNIEKRRPEAKIRLTYTENEDSDNNAILVDVSTETFEPEDETKEFGINFEFTFHRHVEEANQNTKLETIDFILTHWERDLQKAVTIWDKFTS